LNREQKLAATLVRRFALVPPVDVHVLASVFADVEHDDIPGGCDGLALGLDGRVRSRPLILVSRSSNELRERFTVAHELGHVVLPWHGTLGLACDIGAAFGSRYQRSSSEAEANRFAADLLVPPEWLRSILADMVDDDFEALMGELWTAKVSAQVACLALSKELDAGCSFAVLDEEGLVMLAGASSGTSVHLPAKGESLETTRLGRFANATADFYFGSRRVIWWRHDGAAVTDDDDDRPSTVILDELLERHVPDPEQAAAVRRSFAGIVGSANNSVRLGRRFTHAELDARLRQAFTRRRDLPAELLDDPDFASWMRKRTQELAD
jgi:hypothetical protein